MEMGFERRRIEEGLREKSLILGLERDRVLRVRDESVREAAEADMAFVICVLLLIFGIRVIVLAALISSGATAFSPIFCLISC